MRRAKLGAIPSQNICSILAHYIPYLANVDSNLFGISVCLPNGRVISVGDTDYRLGIESVSKVHTAILVLRQLGGHHRR